MVTNKALATKRRVQGRLLRIPGVHAVGFGPKVSGGKLTGELAICVCVLEKKDLSRVPADEVIPREIDGVKTDVVQRQPPKVTADDDAKYRPLVGGVRLQVAAGIAVRRDEFGKEVVFPVPANGTVGCFAQTLTSPPRDVLLSAYHVLYQAPNKVGSKVGQPTNMDSCCWTDIIATVLDGRLTPTVDAAIAALEPNVEWRAQIQDVGAVTGTHTPTEDDLLTEVEIRGFKSGLKKGYLTFHDINGTVEVDLGTGNPMIRKYDEQLEVSPYPGDTEPMLQDGDSGAVMVNKNREVIGLAWGVWSGMPNEPPKYALGSKISDVESELGIKVATNPPATVHVVPEPSLLSFIEPHLGSDALSSNGVRRYLDLVLRHQTEIRTILDSNRRAALAWHRSHGPRLVQHVLEAIRTPDRPLPAYIGASSWSDCVRNILDALADAGSADLREDVARHGTLLTRLGGLSYHQIVVRLATIEDVAAGGLSNSRPR